MHSRSLGTILNFFDVGKIAKCMLPNVADVIEGHRKFGAGTCSRGLGSGRGGVPRGGAHPLVRVRYCFSVPGTPNWSNKKKCLRVIFTLKEEMSYFSYP